MPTNPVARCEYCGELHPVEYSHDGMFGEGPIYGMWANSCGKWEAWLREDGTRYEVEYLTAEGLA